MIIGKTVSLDRESLVKEIARSLSIAPPMLSSGSTVPSSFMRDVAAALGTETSGSTYLVLKNVLDELNFNYEANLDSSEHSPTGGGTITNHGFRKLLRGVSGIAYSFIINFNDHDVSAKYGDEQGKKYSFDKKVNGRIGLLEAGAGSRVVFYKTSKSSTEPKRCFTGSAIVDDVIISENSETTLVFRDYVEFDHPVPQSEVKIVGWNVQNSIAEIESELFEAIQNAGAAPATNNSSLESATTASEVRTEDFSVEIRPEADSLRIYSGLTNTIHYAIGEFIDNSISSALQNVGALGEAFGEGYALRVEVDFDRERNTLTIQDNAAGIPSGEIQSALRTGRRRADNRIGLGVYGVGMKASAFWFGTKLTIQTFPLNESVGWEVVIDISGTAEVEQTSQVKKIPKANRSGTVITISGLRDGVPKAVTLTKTKGFLASIYRDYVGRNEHQGVDLTCGLFFNGEALSYSAPALLEASFWPDQSGPRVGAPNRVWRQDVSVVLSSGKTITGWVGILKTMTRFASGLTLFYAGKAVTGAGLSADFETSVSDAGSGKFKPSKIFSQIGSKLDQSFIGEFDVTALGKTITTDKPNWTDDEQEEFVVSLLSQMKTGPDSLYDMAKNYRRRGTNKTAPTKSEINNLDNRDAKNIELNLSGDLDHNAQPAQQAVIPLDGDDFDGTPSEINLVDKQGHTHTFVIAMIRKREAPLLSIRNADGNAVRHNININLDHPLLDDLEETDLNVRTLIRKVCVAVAATKIFMDSAESESFVRSLNSHFDLMAKKNLPGDLEFGNE